MTRVRREASALDGAFGFFYILEFYCCRGFASAEATRGQWKQTKSAVAPLTPSQRTPPYLNFIVSFLVCIPLTYLEIIGGNDENHNDNARLDG